MCIIPAGSSRTGVAWWLHEITLVPTLTHCWSPRYPGGRAAPVHCCRRRPAVKLLATVGGVSPEIFVLRLDFGYFVRPAGETGSASSRVEPVLGYVVPHPQGTLLLDSGMGSSPDVDDYYRPRRIALPDALHAAGLAVNDLTVVANCHLHFDHCGGNPSLTGLPIVVQEVELASAYLTDYTLPELVDASGLTYERASGDVEIFPGVTVIPTPGHTDGHQSVIVRSGDGSVIVLAGQSHDTSKAFSADALALRASNCGHPPPLPVTPAWMRRLVELDPSRVYFAHDHAVWMPT